MTEPILCQIRDKQHPYGFCVDEKGNRSQAVRLWIDPVKKITRFQCKTMPQDHRFRLDEEGNVIDE